MLLTSDLKKIRELQAESVNKADKGIPREAITEFSIPSKHAVIITGIRRCGKSTLLYQLMEQKYKEVFYLNFDDNRFYGFENNDFLRLDEVIKETGFRTLFFDEIQEIPAWEKFIRQKLDENYRVVLTGSNASLLSLELGSKLTGRHLDKELFPFSFSEFLKAKKLVPDENSVTKYIEAGGFPGYLVSEKAEILSDLFEDIIIRDITVRFGIRDLKSLQRLALWLISNCGNKVTATSLKKTIGIPATSTLMEYFSHLESAYLFYFIPRFSWSVRSQMVNPRKVYSCDTGFITTNSTSFTADYGNKLENKVFNHLRLRHSSVFYFEGKNECDFIVTRKGKIPVAVQVCYNLDRDNLDREINGLFEALEFFKIKSGTVVTMNQTDNFTRKGLTANIVPAWKFLTSHVS